MITAAKGVTKIHIALGIHLYRLVIRVQYRQISQHVKQETTNDILLESSSLFDLLEVTQFSSIVEPKLLINCTLTFVAHLLNETRDLQGKGAGTATEQKFNTNVVNWCPDTMTIGHPYDHQPITNSILAHTAIQNRRLVLTSPSSLCRSPP